MSSTIPVREDFDPLSPRFLADPFAALDELRRDPAPIFYAPLIDYYVLTRHADVERVFRESKTYSAAAAQLPLAPLVEEARTILLAGGHAPQPSMVSLNGPAHTRLRRPTGRAFTVQRVTDLTDTIAASVQRLLDAVAGEPEIELVEALAFPLPAMTIFTLMGVPERDWAQLAAWCGDRAVLSWGRPAPADQVRIATNIAAYRRYLHELVDAKAGAPADDLTSDLLAIHREDPDRLARSEIASILFSLSFAGHETTTGLIGNTVRRLLEDPARWARVVAEPGLIPAALDESLRFDPSVPVWRRITTRPTTLGGVELPEGAKLFLWLAAAGRDPAVFDEPDRFDLHRRNADRHLAFGKGVHACPGPNLGRLEAQLALAELARRYPALRLVEDQQLRFHPNISFRGPQELRVRTG